MRLAGTILLTWALSSATRTDVSFFPTLARVVCEYLALPKTFSSRFYYVRCFEDLDG
jgi:hypothetical protein